MQNFQRTKEIVSRAEVNLQDSFKDVDENRILDIWINLPAQVINQFVTSHFKKMEITMNKIDDAYESFRNGRLVQSIKMMEQLKKVAQETGCIPATQKQYNLTIAGKKAQETVAPHKPVKVYNDKSDNQTVIERRLIGQLGDPF